MWWGRLEQHTKQVRDLIEVGVQLKNLGLDFQLTIIGPDWVDMTAKKLNAEARKRNVGDCVVAVGALHGDELVHAIDMADAFVSTSIIEGFQLAIAEAQSRGLPVFMYELPWLVLVQNNQGIVSVPQGDARGLACEIMRVMGEPGLYQVLSRESVVAAERALTPDFEALYGAVVTGTLPVEYSPSPTLEDARQLLGLMLFFAQQSRKKPLSVTLPGAGSSAGAGARAWQAAAPLGRAALRWLPGLRPLAHRLKGWLGAR